MQDLFLERGGKLIEEIPLGLREENDSWYWHTDKKGEYSVKSSYKYLQIQQRGEEGDREASWCSIWRLSVSGKIKNLLWCVGTGLIPTMVSLHRRHAVPTNTYPCFHEEPETPYHALMQCRVAQSVWRQISGWSTGDSSSSFIDWWKQRCEKFSERDLQLHANICWELWYNRNLLVWKCNAPKIP